MTTADKSMVSKRKKIPEWCDKTFYCPSCGHEMTNPLPVPVLYFLDDVWWVIPFASKRALVDYLNYHTDKYPKRYLRVPRAQGMKRRRMLTADEVHRLRQAKVLEGHYRTTPKQRVKKKYEQR